MSITKTTQLFEVLRKYYNLLLTKYGDAKKGNVENLIFMDGKHFGFLAGYINIFTFWFGKYLGNIFICLIYEF